MDNLNLIKRKKHRLILIYVKFLYVRPDKNPFFALKAESSFQ